MSETTDAITTVLPCAHCGADGELMLYYDFYRFSCPNENCIEHYTDGMMYQGIGKWYGSIQEAREAWNTRAERTCENTDNDEDSYFRCSVCNISTLTEFMSGGYGLPNYCPNCGARVRSE